MYEITTLLLLTATFKINPAGDHRIDQLAGQRCNLASAVLGICTLTKGVHRGRENCWGDSRGDSRSIFGKPGFSCHHVLNMLHANILTMVLLSQVTKLTNNIIIVACSYRVECKTAANADFAHTHTLTTHDSRVSGSLLSFEFYFLYSYPINLVQLKEAIEDSINLSTNCKLPIDTITWRVSHELIRCNTRWENFTKPQVRIPLHAR